MDSQAGISSCSSDALKTDATGLTNAWWVDNLADICTGSDLADACPQAYAWAFAQLNMSYANIVWGSLQFSTSSDPVAAGVLNSIGYVGSLPAAGQDRQASKQTHWALALLAGHAADAILCVSTPACKA